MFCFVLVFFIIFIIFFVFQLLYCIKTYCLVNEMLHANKKDHDLTCKRIESVLKFVLP